MRTPPGRSRRKAWSCIGEGGQRHHTDQLPHLPPRSCCPTLMKANWCVCQVCADSGYVSYRIPAQGRAVGVWERPLATMGFPSTAIF